MDESENTVVQNDLTISDDKQADGAEQANSEATVNETNEAAENTNEVADTEDIANETHKAAENTNEVADAEDIANETHEVFGKKKKIKLPKFLQKINDYLKAHENVRQMVYFFMFSILCGLSQMIVTYGLSAGLKLAESLSPKFDWFVFHYDTTAEFIGFLVGSVVGQVLTFVLNRKKTFNSPDHVVIRAVMYTILAIIIIIMQTYLGGVVTTACYNAMANPSAFLEFLFNLTGQAVAGISALIVNFLGNKFFVMRNWGKKKAKADGAEAETSEQANLEEAANEAHEVAIEAACDIESAEVSE